MREVPSCRLEPAFSSLPGVIQTRLRAALLDHQALPPCAIPCFSVLPGIWLAENTSGQKSKLSSYTYFLKQSLTMLLSETFTLEDWSLLSLLRALLVSIVYCTRVKHSSAFLAVLHKVSSFSLKKIVNYSLYSLSTVGPHWLSLVNHI